jgi:hypothetical protein
VAFGISGFGASQVAAAPQIFQALSVAGGVPQAPAPPYGTPNASLVPVAPGDRAFPANLTLAAQSTFDAILRVSRQTPLDLAHPPIGGTLPQTTTGLAATNPAITFQLQGPAPSGVPGLADVPQGPVSFQVGSPSGPAYSISAIARTAAGIESAQRQSELAGPATLPAVSARTVTSIVRTVTNIAVSHVYPSPLFSFHA